ncbi:glutamate synthase subunit beta [Poseidonibacter ostreae]|jgi:glutamate synthase (NADPH) small chain|uniref:NAD(P)-binding protein n=1 Tax=Poseidonibacter ostreae TaxID=2654171 RepID=A0A6L4WRZ7_9BACT|nr:glutamate synthase subunit beta [Poseidonibacter ostreae]KAB7886152.1 NAD(P)-binding protein [Poseidonibacter ostreae]KAB7887760.1 NAD(P)-binding protein [Poseidonibacter ostreae]KAB7888568.1 NAD(P)-binding protein [Poseidonibacter ostreae]MAC84317.1 glutamate synthase small subunit [Arcobacter sp.]
MLNFTKFERISPEKRDVLLRLKDYDEVYQVFGKQRAKEQADRCMQCGDPYCHTGCPLGNFIPAWLKQTATKNPDLAFALSNETSPFPEILGRICPQDVLCEGACSLNTGHGAISIGAVETHVSEAAFERGLKPTFSNNKKEEKIAIIGSGPAGISAATFLLRKGYQVEMFERADRAGGLLMYGIPGFKLDKTTIDRRVNWLLEAGMKLHLNCEIGKDKSAKELEEEFDSIFIGIGATASRYAGIEGEKSSNVHLAINFLTGIQKRNLGNNNVNFVDVKDKRVVVIGGGDTAMDCVRSSVREGASSVKCLYRRNETNMPGSKKEVVNSKEEGVEFVFNVSPKAIKTDGELALGVELLTTSMSEPDASGRQKVVINEGSEYLEEADIIIFALGFSPEAPAFLNDLNVETNSWGGIEINKSFQTSNNKVYAGGDCERGAHLAVTAAADGRDAARAIIKTLA